jgi:hypothetical protein
MLYLVFSILIFAFFAPEYTQAFESGVGVTPSRITVEQNVEWPYTVPITVTNFSAQEEQFEVLGAAANPGRFVLGPGGTRSALVTFDGPGNGTIKVVSKRVSEEGFTTGTGVKIPFEVHGQQPGVNFTAGAALASGWGSMAQVFAGFVILLAIWFLWYLANYASA